MSAQHIDNLRLLSTQPPDSFENRQVSFTRPVLLQTLSAANTNRSVSRNHARESVDEGRLPDAGFAGYKYYLTFSCEHLLKPGVHARQGFVAPYNSRGGIC